MNLYSFIIPVGIAAYVIILFAVLTGLRIIHFTPKRHFKIHKWLGIIALIIGTIHAGIVIYIRM